MLLIRPLLTGPDGARRKAVCTLDPQVGMQLILMVMPYNRLRRDHWRSSECPHRLWWIGTNKLIPIENWIWTIPYRSVTGWAAVRKSLPLRRIHLTQIPMVITNSDFDESLRRPCRQGRLCHHTPVSRTIECSLPQSDKTSIQRTH